MLFVTTAGVLAAFWQIRIGARSQRATFLKDLYIQLRSDPAIVEAFYKVEYDKFEYGSDFHHSELEAKVDRLLTLIDLVCEMRAQRILTTREMSFFEYPLGRVAQNQSIQAYLRFLNDFYDHNEVSKKPFAAFQEYANRQKLKKAISGK